MVLEIITKIELMFVMKQDTVELPNITLSVNWCNFCIIICTRLCCLKNSGVIKVLRHTIFELYCFILKCDEELF